MQQRRFDPADTRRVVVELYAGADEVTRVGVSPCRVDIEVRSESGEASLERGVPED